MSERRKTLERTLTRTLSELITELQDPRIPMIVTVERARFNADLSQAKVLVSALGDEREIENMEVALNRASGFLQRELAKEMRSRNTPKLTFTTDPSQVL